MRLLKVVAADGLFPEAQPRELLGTVDGGARRRLPGDERLELPTIEICSLSSCVRLSSGSGGAVAATSTRPPVAPPAARRPDASR